MALVIDVDVVAKDETDAARRVEAYDWPDDHRVIWTGAFVRLLVVGPLPKGFVLFRGKVVFEVKKTQEAVA